MVNQIGRQIQLLAPRQDGGYSRTFSAEIGCPAENEISVRGVMRDHRFAIEHTWRVLLPGYQVTEASARQIAGDAEYFNPVLCTRYPQIRGVRIGRGFSKRVVAELGELPGNQEHLWLAIEMARVGQQVYQFPAEFDRKFPPASREPAELARVAWIKDRAYLADLANSCYTYRDASAGLFESREVRCGFDPALTRPKPGDERVFWRDKSVSVRLVNSTAFACQSSMEDTIHDIRIAFDLSGDGMVSNAQSRGLRLPYHGICEDAQTRTPGLNGLRVTSEFIRQFADRVGGAQGCTHLFDLSIDCLRLFRITGSASGPGNCGGGK